MSPFPHPKKKREYDYICHRICKYANSNMLSIVSRTCKPPVIVDIIDCLFPIKIIQLTSSKGKNQTLVAFLVSMLCMMDALSIPQGTDINIWGMASLGTVARGTEKITDPCGH